MLVRQLGNPRRVLLRIAVVGLVIAAVTAFCYRVIPVNATTAGFAYLIAILIFASGWGLIEGIAGCLFAIPCYNFFFLPPVGAFTIADPQNWVALFTFLLTAVIASQLSDQSRRRERDAMSRQREMERLYALSRAILLADPSQEPGRHIARQIAQIFDLRAVELFVRQGEGRYFAGAEELTGLETRLRDAASQGTFFSDPATNTLISAIRLGGGSIGSLAVRGGAFSDAALQSVCNLVAIVLERARAHEAANRAEVARQSEELKSTLLDAIAHEFQTPLTSVRAAASSLLASPAATPEQQRELLSIVDEEANRLSKLVTEAIQMARTETGKVRLNRMPCSAKALLDDALEKIRDRAEGRAITAIIPPDLPPVLVDPEMMELTLRQLLDNALKYSPAGSPLTVQARQEADHIVMSVSDHGPGIPEAEQSRIFEKFYRRSDHPSSVTGSGMGLAIAREIVHAHGGEIWVESKPGEGSRFSISLPLGAAA
ncbi:MAG TPA: ATP-binding protein [Bryobacteraceae bacterium]|nr:ATP-binding protein [Bryobacteraceae bacterium]